MGIHLCNVCLLCTLYMVSYPSSMLLYQCHHVYSRKMPNSVWVQSSMDLLMKNMVYFLEGRFVFKTHYAKPTLT